MKKHWILILTGIVAATLIGCEDDDNLVGFSEPPQPPQGVFSITGDQQVTIVWTGLWESDIVEYVIGWNDELFGEYEGFASVSASPRPDDNQYSFVDTDVSNGVTIFYAVWAVDREGQASDPSYEIVFDTPRPDGQANLYSMSAQPSLAGFNLSTGDRVNWDAASADVFLTHDMIYYDIDTILNDTPAVVVDSTVVFTINANQDPNLDRTDIQDMGYTLSFDDVGWAPDRGWSQLQAYEVIEGHTYVIWTNDLHYGKMRVNSTSQIELLVNFDWAYQPIGPEDTLANRELIGPPPDAEENEDQAALILTD